MKVLRAKPGYILHNKENDTYTTEVYMPDTADTSRYEEVLREGADPILYEAVEAIKEENTEQNEVIDVSLLATDEVYTEYGKIIDVLLLSIDELYNMIGGEGGE